MLQAALDFVNPSLSLSLQLFYLADELLQSNDDLSHCSMQDIVNKDSRERKACFNHCSDGKAYVMQQTSQYNNLWQWRQTYTNRRLPAFEQIRCGPLSEPEVTCNCFQVQLQTLPLISLKAVHWLKFQERNSICALFGCFCRSASYFTVLFGTATSDFWICRVCVFERQNWFTSHRDMTLSIMAGISSQREFFESLNHLVGSSLIPRL